MDRTVVLVVTHRGLSEETRSSLQALKCPSQVILKGVADVSRARSQAFDQVLELTEDTPIDTVLCIDDDMLFPPEAARGIIERSRMSGHPVSGCAVTEKGMLAARPLKPNDRSRWLTGLACMAVPRARLVELAPTLPVLGETRAWCLSGPHPELPLMWTGEDVWFCLHFGGVELAPIAFGHVKAMPIWPTADSMRAALMSPS